MKFIISGRNIDITDGLRNAVEDKLGKLEKFFTDDTEIHVTLSVEKERQKIEVTIPVKGNIIRSEQVSNDMYVSIDLVEEIIERPVSYTHLDVYKRQLMPCSSPLRSFNLLMIVPENSSGTSIYAISMGSSFFPRSSSW